MQVKSVCLVNLEVWVCKDNKSLFSYKQVSDIITSLAIFILDSSAELHFSSLVFKPAEICVVSVLYFRSNYNDKGCKLFKMFSFINKVSSKWQIHCEQ